MEPGNHPGTIREPSLYKLRPSGALATTFVANATKGIAMQLAELNIALLRAPTFHAHGPTPYAFGWRDEFEPEVLATPAPNLAGAINPTTTAIPS